MNKGLEKRKRDGTTKAGHGDRSLPASVWQPIETAPKDGTQILAFAFDKLAFYGVAQWAVADPAFPRTVSGWFWPFAIRPTHWMPLPEPPADAKGGEA